LQKRQLLTTGNKVELIARLQGADPEGHWIQELEVNATSNGNEVIEDEGLMFSQVNVRSNRDKASEDVLRELEFLRKEQRLIERKVRESGRERKSDAAGSE